MLKRTCCFAKTLQSKSRLCQVYPTPYQGQRSPSLHQPIFYPRSYQEPLIAANKLNCIKNILPLTIAQKDVFYCEATSTHVATMRGLPHTVSGQRSPGLHQPIFYPRSYQEPLIVANKFKCTKKSFAINHCSNGRVLLRRHFNASATMRGLPHTTSGSKVA